MWVANRKVPAGILFLMERFGLKKNDTLSILITFVVGFVAGGYLYIAHFSKLLGATSIPTESSAEDFTLVGEVYGSCGTQCPAFQLLQTGSYRYQYVPTDGQSKEILEGTLPLDIQRAVRNSLTETALREQSKRVTPRDCNSYQGNIDVKYTVTLDGETFVLDSCGTAIDGNGRAWESLSTIWSYFDSIN
jgi:hypothetical protein